MNFRTNLILACASMAGGLFFGASPALGWTSADTPPANTPPRKAFTVDSSIRGDALSFYQNIYRASENALPVMGWTGIMAPPVCLPGTISDTYRNHVQRRVNYFRAISGIYSTVTFDQYDLGSFDPTLPLNTLKTTTVQAAALLNSASNLKSVLDIRVSHQPPNDWPCWSALAYHGCDNSNLAVSFNGPEAIDAYMRESEANTDPVINADAGHRRWINYSMALDFSTGDVPPSATNHGANALYVLDTADSGPVQFVAYPTSTGYFPAHLASPRWSLSHPNANFAAATVRVFTASGTEILPISVKSRTYLDAGDNTIVFDVPSSSFSTTALADQIYKVTVANIQPVSGTIQSSFNYDVKLFNPTVSGSSPTLTGSATPPQSGAAYTINPVPYADGYDVRLMKLAAGATFTEGAEDPATYSSVSNNTTTLGANSASVSFAPSAGTKSFQLTFTTANSGPQVITLTKPFIPSSTSALSFKTMKRMRAIGTQFKVQISANFGGTWEDVHSYTAPSAVLSTATTNPEFDQTLKALAAPINLGAYDGKVCQLRLRMEKTNLFVDGTTHNHGIAVDEIAVTNAGLVSQTQSTIVPAASIVGGKLKVFPNMAPGGALTPATVFRLSYAPMFGPQLFEAPKALTLTPSTTTGIAGWIEGFYPSLAGTSITLDHDKDRIPSLIEYAFGLDPTLASPTGSIPAATFSGGNLCMTIPSTTTNAYVSTVVQFSADMKTWTDLTPTVNGANKTFCRVMGAGKSGYLRVKCTQLP